MSLTKIRCYLILIEIKTSIIHKNLNAKLNNNKEITLPIMPVCFLKTKRILFIQGSFVLVLYFHYSSWKLRYY